MDEWRSNRVFAVIARSEATKQSWAKESLPARSWIASLRSQ
jgi:hypothetical protein